MSEQDAGLDIRTIIGKYNITQEMHREGINIRHLVPANFGPFLCFILIYFASLLFGPGSSAGACPSCGTAKLPTD